MKVLILDDERMLAELLCDHLRKKGFDAKATCRTSDAIFFLDTWSPDVVVTDVRMPCGGAPVLMLRCEQMRTPPQVVIITGSDFDWAREVVARNKAAALLEKPFSLRSLTVILEQIDARRLIAVAPDGEAQVRAAAIRNAPPTAPVRVVPFSRSN